MRAPQFASIEEESEFWDTHDSTEYMDGTEPVDVIFVDKRPKTQISLRIEPEVIAQLKQVATAKGMGYQTLMRMWVLERLQAELAQQKSDEPVRAAG